jgi:hypothetical protein
VKIYVAAVAALGKKEREDETQFTANIGGNTSLGPSYFVLQNFIHSIMINVSEWVRRIRRGHNSKT